jgi:hypothetical protein
MAWSACAPAPCLNACAHAPMRTLQAGHPGAYSPSTERAPAGRGREMLWVQLPNGQWAWAPSSAVPAWAPGLPWAPPHAVPEWAPGLPWAPPQNAGYRSAPWNVGDAGSALRLSPHGSVGRAVGPAPDTPSCDGVGKPCTSPYSCCAASCCSCKCEGAARGLHVPRGDGTSAR